MRFITIWTLSDMAFTERLRRTREWGNWKLAALLPKRLRYFTTMLEIGKATTKMPADTVIPAIPLDTLLQKLEAPVD